MFFYEKFLRGEQWKEAELAVFTICYYTCIVNMKKICIYW